MKHILTLVALVFATACFGQEVCAPPLDSNQDGLIGIDDMLNLLSLFGDSDYDFDGVWDSVDDCIGEYDECGFCNGPGIPEGYCSCTETLDALGVCGGNCALDFDGDGVCDEFLGPCYAESLLYHGYEYNLIAIGNQCWFSENLRTESYANGDEIPLGFGGGFGATQYTGQGRRTYSPDFGPEYVSHYGFIYNHYACTDDRNVCPTGWHVPSDEDWNKLEIVLGLDSSQIESWGINRDTEGIGTALKSAMDDNPAWDGENTTGLSLVPGGYANYGSPGDFYDSGVGQSQYAYGAYWTSSGISVNQGVYRSAQSGYYGSSFTRGYSFMLTGYSVRCIKDSE